jgi:hypothetical protein
VYEALVQAWLDREERKLHKQGRDDINAGTLYDACLLVAEQMQRSGSRFLSEARLNEWMKEQPELESLTQIKFGGRSLLNRTAAGDYRFSHFSIQDFSPAQQVMREAEKRHQLVVPKFASEKVIRFVLDGRSKACPQKTARLARAEPDQVRSKGTGPPRLGLLGL